MKKIIYILFALFSVALTAQTTTTTVGTLKLNNTPTTVTGSQYHLVRNQTTKLVEQQLITGGGGGGIDHAKGNYDALNNLPVLVNGSGILGDYYTVTIAGTQFGYGFKINDRVEYNGANWVKVIDNNAGDINLDDKYIPLSGTISGNAVVGRIELSRGDGGFYSNDATSFNNFDADVAGWSLQGTNNINGFSDSFTTNDLSFTVLSNNPSFRGLEGGSNYSANYLPNSFVQKAYVDALVSGAGNTNISYTPTLRQINSSTGTGAVLPIADGTDYGLSINDFTNLEKSKLSGVQTGATANSTDADLRDRSTHTGFQPQSSVSGLVTDLSSKLSIVNNLSDLNNISTARTNLGLGNLATQNGTVSGTNTGDNSPNTLYSALVSNATHTGDATGSTELTLATVNSNVGGFGNNFSTPVLFVDAKGRITSIANNPIQITQSQVTSLTSDLLNKLSKTSNLSDLNDFVASRNNLGLGTLATQNGTFSGTSSGINTGDNANTTGTASNITGNLPQSQVTGLTTSLIGKLPYVGATQDLDLGANILFTSAVQMGATFISETEIGANGFSNNFPLTAGRLANSVDLANKAGTQNTQIFTANGTWTKPVGAKAVSITIIGGGGGAGSGRKGAAATVRCAGGAGGSAGVSKNVFDASELTATVSITVGTGGTGGASQATNSTNGNNGIAGGQSSFGLYLRATGGGLGAGGTLTTGTGGGAGAGLSFAGASGVSASTTGGAGGSGNASALYGQPSGATGGGITSANVASSGGSGNVVPTFSNQTFPATNAGAININATNGAIPISSEYGFGGGGGGSSLTANGGNGGNGSGYGSGGGSGGASVDAVGNSGAGGNGAPGVVIVKTYF